MLNSTDIGIFAVLSLASGRVAFALTKDEIFRGLRESIWMHSPPEDGMVVTRGEDGDQTRPARMFHEVEVPVEGITVNADGERIHGVVDVRLEHEFDPGKPLREPQFLGQLFECPYCMSFWTSLAACAAWLIVGDSIVYPALPLAMWAVANSFAVKGL